jgi:hypothetical protein
LQLLSEYGKTSCMSAREYDREQALSALVRREVNTTRTRLAAARLCLDVASLSGHEGLLADALNHFELPAAGGVPRPRRGRAKEYGFWLDGAQELRFRDGIFPAPRAAAITVHTDRFARGDDDGVTLALHTKPYEPALRVKMQVYNETPQWWFELGETQSYIGGRFRPEGEVNMKQYLAEEVGSAAVLGATSEIILTSLSTATWNETLNIQGDLL